MLVHQAYELGVEAEMPGHDWIPALVCDTQKGQFKSTSQKVPTLDWFAKLTRSVLLAILQADHPESHDEDVDPESWLFGKSYLMFPADMIG